MARRFWTAAEDRSLRKLYRSLTAGDCAAELNRSVSAVQQRVNVLGLSKSAEWIAECTRRRWAEGRHDNSRAALAGGRGWNKGIKGSTGTHANCRKSQFRKGYLGGAAAAKHQPIGTLRITRDGALERKISDDPLILPRKRWCAVARLVWEEVHGPIPSGHAVVFKPGRATVVEAHITIDVLELVTRVELMRRNSRHTRYPPEVNQLIQLRGALNRKINARSNPA